MMTSSGTVVLLCSLLLLMITPIGTAAECPYGSVHAWYRSSDGEWENATAHPKLQRGESFEIKIRVQRKTELKVVYLKLHEFGTPVYEVITGPSIIEQLLEHWGLTHDNESIEYLWKLRVRANTSWVDGYSPLEVYVQFTKNDADDASVTFDIVNAYILDRLWEHYSSNTTDATVSKKDNDTLQLSYPSTAGLLVLIFFSGIVLRKKQAR